MGEHNMKRKILEAPQAGPITTPNIRNILGLKQKELSTKISMKADALLSPSPDDGDAQRMLSGWMQEDAEEEEDVKIEEPQVNSDVEMKDDDNHDTPDHETPDNLSGEGGGAKESDQTPNDEGDDGR